jgi:acetyl-CoA C-acetyltransferase
MLQTAENVAERYGIPHERQDEYGVASQQRAAAARAAGRFDEEIVLLRTRRSEVDRATGRSRRRS